MGLDRGWTFYYGEVWELYRACTFLDADRPRPKGAKERTEEPKVCQAT